MGWLDKIRTVLPVTLVIAIGVVVGCAPRPLPTPTPTKTPDPALAMLMAGPTATLGQESAAVLSSLTPELPMPTVEEQTAPPPATEADTIPTSESTEAPTETLPPPTPDDGLPPDHYWLERPIPSGWTDYIDRTYPYGATAGGQYRPHTGGEFFNPASTPVVAVGNATVAYAGTDWEVLYGPALSFYGNLIIIQLTDYTYNGRPVYALYGHLSEIYVQTGQAVAVGEIIGAVGATGVANGGAHLHFEVRLDDPQSYFTSTRNPDLWIKPYWGYGTLAGRVLRADGAMLREVALTIKGDDATRYAWTYAGDENISDDAWGENFTYGDLPEGWYTVTTRSSKRTHSEEVYVRAGRTSWLEFIFEQ